MAAQVTTTSFRVRAVPVGAAIQISRRLFALGPRLTVRALHEFLAVWWEAGAAGASPAPGWDGETRLGVKWGHPLDYALDCLEAEPDPSLKIS